MAKKPVFGSALDAYEAGSRFMDVQYALVTFRAHEARLWKRQYFKLPYAIQTHDGRSPDVWVAVTPVAQALGLTSGKLMARHAEKAGVTQTTKLIATSSGKAKSRGRPQPMLFLKVEDLMLILLRVRGKNVETLISRVYDALSEALPYAIVRPSTLANIMERHVAAMEVRCDSLYNALMAERMSKNPKTWLNILIEERDPLVMRPLYQYHQEKGWKAATETIAPALTQLLESLTTLPLSPQQEALAEDVRQSLEQLQSKKTDDFSE